MPVEPDPGIGDVHAAPLGDFPVDRIQICRVGETQLSMRKPHVAAAFVGKAPTDEALEAEGMGYRKDPRVVRRHVLVHVRAA